jgi:hypothetical protein
MYKIPLLLILFFISSFCFAQRSKMDVFEQQMLTEYQYYNLKEILDMVVSGETEKKFKIGDKKYKVKIKRTSLKAETDEIIHYIIKTKGKQFIFSTDSEKYYLQSQGLSFSFRYTPMQQEISFISKPFSNPHEFKMYGYTYRYIKGELFKLEDWVIRDAIGRANSIE